MDRTRYIDIAGKEYPMRFSLGVSLAITEKYGSLDGMVKKVEDTKNETEVFKTVIWLLEIFIRQGCAYKNLFEPDVPVPENAPVRDGKYIPLTSEEIAIGMETNDLGEATKKIFEVISGGSKREVKEKEDKKGKNAEAM